MGFWGAMKNMATGKPVFEVDSAPKETDQYGVWSNDKPSDGQDEYTTGVTTEQDSTRDSSGSKIIPEVTVTHVKSHLNGANMEVYAVVVNAASVPVFLDKMHLLGQKYELDRLLGPGQSHNYRIYRGPAFTYKPHSDADVEYRLESNHDYFRARFYLEFDYQNGYYLPEEFHLEGPIKDI